MTIDTNNPFIDLLPVAETGERMREKRNISDEELEHAQALVEFANVFRKCAKAEDKKTLISEFERLFRVEVIR
jgi:hypothetical protein